MFNKMDLKFKPFLALTGAGLLLSSVYFYQNVYTTFSITTLVLIALLNVVFSREREVIVGISVTIFSTLYLGLISYVYIIRSLPGGWMWLVFLFACTWASDTMAFFGGKLFGSNPLAPSISPGKTREGALTGILASIITAYLLTLYYPVIPIGHALLLGFFVAVAGQLGDLVESSLKRESGVKDSGSIIPGHGGVLDRFDSMLLTAPLVYYYIVYLIL